MAPMIFGRGDELRLALSVFVLEGRSLESIAEQYDVTEAQLRQYARLDPQPPTLREKLEAIITDSKEKRKK